MPFSIAGPAYSAQPSLDSFNRVAESISSGKETSYQNNAAEAAIAGRLDTIAGEQTVTIRNATAQVSALQKADNTLGQASELVERIQAFSVQIGNPALSESDRDIIRNEASDQLDQAADLISNDSFNGQSLFGDDSPTGIDTESLQQKLDELRNSPRDSQLDSEALKAIQQEISEKRAEIGASQNAVTTQIETLENNRLTTAETQSRIQDTDYAEAFTQLIKEELLFQANVSVFNQQRLAEESILNLLAQ